jgi:hypothetical protein
VILDEAEALLDPVSDIEGFMLACLVDATSVRASPHEPDLPVTRARQLTSTVLPGRRPDGYADQETGRLRRIAAARSTGMLPFSGRSDGSIYFRDGKVAYAESARTPGPAPNDQPGPDPMPAALRRNG